MRSKIISIVVFIILFYILPLSPRYDLIFTPQLGFAIFFCILLFVTQPPLIIEETRENYNKDKNSIWIIFIGAALTQFLAVLEWAHFQNDFINFKIDILTVLGLLFSFGGMTLRIWSIKTLGKNFTATVKTHEKQTIIKSGVYKVVRHPSYLGAYIAIVGGSMFMHSYYSIVFSILIMFFAYFYRIKHEEIALVEKFGEEYREYQNETKKLIPLIY